MNVDINHQIKLSFRFLFPALAKEFRFLIKFQLIMKRIELNFELHNFFK